MDIIDAHHHLWDRSRFRYGWLASVPEIDADFLLLDYVESTRGTGVVKSVFVQADVDAEFALQETRWALSLAESDAAVDGVVAWAPVESDDLLGYLEKLGSHEKLKGIRRLIQGEGDDFCARPQFIEGMRTLAKAGYSFDLCVYHSQLSAAIDLVRSVPEMAFVLDHLGKPPIRTGDMAPWAAHIRELAALPNVQCKLSGMVTEADPKNWTPEQLRPYIHVALEAFGPEWIQFGSDWPVSLLGISYGAWIDIVREAVTDLSSSEQEAFFYGNAARFYRL